ncbi:hypothetical protein BDZ45DRAFT_751981 [Acephala macrosclerotiorum]|nr:hypothetical protein BDZ45DRAFT_751981 [Acephala macrosclerotiorum]
MAILLRSHSKHFGADCVVARRVRMNVVETSRSEQFLESYVEFSILLLEIRKTRDRVYNENQGKRQTMDSDFDLSPYSSSFNPNKATMVEQTRRREQWVAQVEQLELEADAGLQMPKVTSNPTLQKEQTERRSSLCYISYKSPNRFEREDAGVSCHGSQVIGARVLESCIKELLLKFFSE